MENKSHAIAAGLFTILLVAATIAIGMWLTRDQSTWIPYEIATEHSIPGLSPQAAVRYRGLDVGRVDTIRFDPEQAGRILVGIRVRPDTPITHSTFASLGYQGVTGVAYVQLDDDGSKPAPLPSSEADPARLAMRPGLFEQLQYRGLAIMEQTEDLARRLNVLMTDENQQTILAAFDNVSRAAREIEKVPRQLEPALASIAPVMRRAERAMGSLETVAGNGARLTANLDGMVDDLRAPDGTLARIAGAAEQVGSVAYRIENETLPIVTDVRSSIRALNRALDNLAERPQSVLYGAPVVAPGPGEPGFVAPSR
ncbi:MAG TPA: MlaD family protein [Noviherbaspirillum sp.]|nr:MlaD family protein [Noviherbaspirillum sp.]